MSLISLGIGFVLGFIVASIAIDKYYMEQSNNRLKAFSREIMREFAKALAEIERAKNKANISTLN